MLQNDEPLHIRAVENGFIVEPGYDLARRDEVISREDTKVFRSLTELCAFLGDHFTHRAGHIEVDA